MMGEPLFDELSAAFVLCGLVAVAVLRSAIECPNPETAKTRGVVGHILLGIAVSILLYRWSETITSLPSLSRRSLWQGAALSTACGIALVAATKAVIAVRVASRVRYFVIAVVSSSIALCIASAWLWAALLLVLLAAGLLLGHRLTRRSDRNPPSSDEVEPQREPTLVVLVSATLLLLLIGTWNHVVEHETQRKTRSARYSAWPRATALKDAWERTGWAAKPGDEASAARVVSVASREQRIALGLGTLLLVVMTVSLRRASEDVTTSEADHAS